MDKKTFITAIENIRKQVNHDRDIEQAILSMIDKDQYAPMFTTPLITDMIRLLETIMCDKGETISYFIWDIDWGKKGKNCITEKDGKKISLTTAGELYDYLRDQQDVWECFTPKNEEDLRKYLREL